MQAQPDYIDEGTVALYLEVPGEKVVLLQALVESHEGVGIVRTLNIRKSLVCVLTTPTMFEACVDLLNGLQAEIGWRFIGRPKEAEEQLYLGYFKKNQGNSPC
ncbi:MAG: DUF4911 domain-containing protein [Deltaproteobacteria bacterium]|nr:DUF4911 domain-containing protein [Deltaproteobacteria bacterium]